MGKPLTKLERDFQANLRKELEDMLPGCLILKQDPQLQQGILDLLILFGKNWIALEVKRSRAEALDPRPNQPYFVSRMREMSYAAFIYPENKDEILDEIRHTFSL